jgi:predicted dehydrogenase
MAIGVGIVGASPDRGWARAAHLPALAHLDEFELTAVATTRQDTAQRTANAYGIRHAFADAGELAAHPDVDLVVVSVRSPDHAKAIRAALAAGKHVFSEWPLGVDLAEAAALTDAATAAGIVHAVSLQSHQSPSVHFVQDLLAAGEIGQVESISVIAAGNPLGGSRILRDLAWSVDRAQGNTVLSIMTGHTMATIDQLAGPLTEVSAVVATLHDQVVVAETGQTIANSAPNHVALFGRLAGGAMVSASVQGGNAPGPDGFLIKIVGTDGALTITPVEPAHYMNWADWHVHVTAADGTVSPRTVPERYRLIPADLPAGPQASVAALYREIAHAISEGRPAHPDFRTALRHHRLLDAVERASRTGLRQPVAG